MTGGQFGKCSTLAAEDVLAFKHNLRNAQASFLDTLVVTIDLHVPLSAYTLDFYFLTNENNPPLMALVTFFNFLQPALYACHR